jgi:hypothetical protein
MATGELGKVYQDGEVIICQGEEGTCMYVIQEGQVEVVLEGDGQEVRIGVRGPGEWRSSTVMYAQPQCVLWASRVCSLWIRRTLCAGCTRTPRWLSG